jgi:hypothetical protein
MFRRFFPKKISKSAIILQMSGTGELSPFRLIPLVAETFSKIYLKIYVHEFVKNDRLPAR